MINENVRLYIGKCRAYLNLVLSMQQWSGITGSNIDCWLENFLDVDPDDMLYVYKLLSNIIYYSEEDIIAVLKDGINNALFREDILREQIDSAFQLSPKALRNFIDQRIHSACFIPLLVKNAPHESANYILRLLVQQEMVKAEQSHFLSDLENAVIVNGYKRIVVVDDCLGSGDQLREFWNMHFKFSGGFKTLQGFCKDRGIEVCYLVLFGYNKSMRELKRDFQGLNIICLKELTDEHKVFSETSYIWEDAQEREKAAAFFQGVAQSHSIEFHGYGEYDFAFMMHKTIPDWSLPMLWRESAEWNSLLRRKNSHV